MPPTSTSGFVADSTHLFHQNSGALPTVLLLLGVALLVAVGLPRRRILTGAAGVSLAVAIGLTITPFGGWSMLGFETGALHSIVTNLTPHRTALTGWFRNPDGPPNVLLFLPAGLFVALLLRRPVRSAVALTGLSFAIECWQATLTTRVGSFDDVVANGLGAAIGAGLATVVLATQAVVRHAARRARPEQARQLTPTG